MIEKMKQLKNQYLDVMERDVKQRGAEGVNIKFHGEVADIVKDLSEAIYYCEVVKAMEGDNQQSGYGMGYGTGGGMGRSGYGGSPANGGNMMGHSDPVSAIRDMMMTADPDTKMRIRNELGMM